MWATFSDRSSILWATHKFRGLYPCPHHCEDMHPIDVTFHYIFVTLRYQLSRPEHRVSGRRCTCQRQTGPECTALTRQWSVPTGSSDPAAASALHTTNTPVISYATLTLCTQFKQLVKCKKSNT